ncbi:MAG: alpha/beta hydrolase, partial [Smithella sp.]
MKKNIKIVRRTGRRFCKSNIKHFVILIVCLVFLILVVGPIKAQAQWPHIVPSKDGTPISYEVYGSGEPTLVFVHGWSCDSRYWRAQVPHFSKEHRVVTLDLAGHGHSGMTRKNYSMVSFGEDVQAVTEATGRSNVILIG